jgi:hypothetical protein
MEGSLAEPPATFPVTSARHEGCQACQHFFISLAFRVIALKYEGGDVIVDRLQ